MSITRRGLMKGCAGIGAGMVAGCVGSMRGGGEGEGRPNVVVMIADDLGFECLGAYGGESYKTPNLDRLARSGMMFRQHFGTPVCSPARAQMLTGRYSFRSGFIDISGRSGAAEGLDPRKEVTLAKLMKEAGYATAVTGKWHLGWGSRPTTGPAEFDRRQYRASSNIAACGFQEQYCFSGSHITYGEPVKGQYHPDLYQEWALRYLEGRRGKRRPFFMYYGLGLVHFDFDPTPLNPEGKKNDRKNFPYMVEYLDGQIGEFVAKLEETRLRANTLILFSSDNGCDGFKSKLNGREVVGGKSGMKDTGTWVPLLASWPGGVRAGSECDDLTDYTDFLPTVCEVGGAKVPGDRVIDGRSFVGQMRGEKVKGREWVYVQLTNKWFIREKKWKLRENGRMYDLSNTPFEEKRVEEKDATAEAREARKRLAGALVGLVAGEGASKRPAAGAKLSTKATVEKAELEVILSLVSVKGGPVMAEVVLRNRGKKEMRYGSVGEGLDVAMRVYDTKGEAMGKRDLAGKEQKIVEGEKRVRCVVDLSALCGGLKAGTYSVTMECEVEGEEVKGKKRMMVERVAFVVGES